MYLFEEIIAAARQPCQSTTGSAKSKSGIYGDCDSLMANDKIRITVVGCGGGGCNTVNRMSKMGLKSAKTVAINTDKPHLDIIGANKKVLIGSSITRGMGAGGFPEVGMKCAEMSKSAILEAMGENEIVFLCAGMGGGTGTGSAPVVAKLAKEQGATVVAIVTYPFNLERARLKKAQWGLEQLSQVADTVIVIDNNKLVSFAPNLPMNQAFELADRVTSKAIKGIADTIMFPSLLNIDYADVKSVMENGGVSLISIGESSGPDKIEKVVNDTLNNPLLDVDYEGAKGALIHIGGGNHLTLGETIEIGEKLTEAFDPNAHVKIGARLSPEYGSGVQCILIATGLKATSFLKSNLKEKQTDYQFETVKDIAYV